MLKRAAMFTGIWFFIYLYFILDKNYHQYASMFFFMGRIYYPLTIWILLLGYMLFPSRKKCNGQGRYYMLRYIWYIVFFFIYKCNFIIRFISDQFVSFVAIFKDIDYTFCFYSNYI